MGMELKNVKKIPKTENKYIKNSLNVGIEWNSLSFIPTYSEVRDEVRIVCFKK